MKSFINKIRFTIINNKLFSLFLVGFWIFIMFYGNNAAKFSYTLLIIALFQNEYVKTRYVLIISTMMLNLEDETKMAIKLSDERINRKGE